jgi:phosphatidylglycerophosphate synthase
MEPEDTRRPIATRANRWAIALSNTLTRSAVTPNQISLLSIFFASLGAASLAWAKSPWLLLACAICVQLRLLCNLLDGMVAIEGGKKTKSGPIFNEFPDRIADSVLLVALGYAAAQPWLGWLGALLAALTAYVRVFGGSLGQVQIFAGPMAKPHRMAVLTAACVFAAAELQWSGTRYALLAAAGLIAFGSLLTCIIRTRMIVLQLH